MTRKSEPENVIWTPQCTKAFRKLKELLLSAPVMMNPDFSCLFILQTDASEVGVGAVLSQTDAEGCDHPVAYVSRKLLPREQKYATIEKECLAIKLVELKHFKSIYWVMNSRSKQITEHSSGLQNSKTAITDYCNGVWHCSHFGSKLCIAKDEIMPMLILFPNKLNGRTILGQRRGKECDRRAEAEVNWTGLTLIMFIVFVLSVKIAT